MGQLIGIVVAIVVINLIGGLLQAVAKKREQQRKLEQLRASGGREAAPVTAPKAAPTAVGPSTLGRGQGVGMNPGAGGGETGAARAAARLRMDDQHFGGASLARGLEKQTATPRTPERAATAASTQQQDLERRRRAQLEELRRRRGTMPGRPAPTVTPTAPTMPPPKREVAQRAPDRTPRTPAPAGRTADVALARTTQTRADSMKTVSGRSSGSAAANPIVAMRGTVTAAGAAGPAAYNTPPRRLLGLIKGPGGLARLREAVILREVLDCPIALRQPGGQSGL